MATPIVAPYVPTYTAAEPYISVAEFQAYPTGINLNQLAVGAGVAVNADTIRQQILNASAWADGFCNQPLGCTPVVQSGWYRAKSGHLFIPLLQYPVVQVNGATLGSSVTNQEELATLEGVGFPAPNVISVPYTDSLDSYATIEYLAGYPNTFLTALSADGATELTVGNTLGLVPGSVLTINEPGATETVTVASVTDTVITLASATTSAHVVGANVSALPPAVKQAVVMLTACLIRMRASESTVIATMQGSISTQSMDPAIRAQFNAAQDLLTPFKRVA